MKTLITGASRGIGLELTRLALEHKHQVIAFARSPDKSEGLRKLLVEYKNQLQLISGDVTRAKENMGLKSALDQVGALDILINNASILIRDTFDNLTAETLRNTFDTNTIAPVQMTQVCLPYLEKSEQPKLVNITSLMGSVSDNKSGAYYSYRMSKAALNMFSKSFSIDFPRISTVVLHPGWVKTDMGGEAAPLSPTESATGLWKIVESLRKEQSGRFFDYRGRELPW